MPRPNSSSIAKVSAVPILRCTLAQARFSFAGAPVSRLPSKILFKSRSDGIRHLPTSGDTFPEVAYYGERVQPGREDRRDWDTLLDRLIRQVRVRRQAWGGIGRAVRAANSARMTGIGRARSKPAKPNRASQQASNERVSWRGAAPRWSVGGAR